MVFLALLGGRLTVGQQPLKLFMKVRLLPPQQKEYTYTMKFTSIAVFVLFFGLALIEALQRGNWLEAAFCLALGALSLWADFSKKE